MVARHGPLDLLLFTAYSYDEPVVIFGAAGLYQYGSFTYGDAIRLALEKFLHQAFGSRADRRVDEGIQLFQPAGLIENFGGKRASIDGRIGVEDSTAELGDHGVVGFAAGLQHLMAEFVGTD